MSLSRRYPPAERLPLAARIDYALEHIGQYERDIVGRVPLDVFGLKQLLEDVRRALQASDAARHLRGQHDESVDA